jgi:hypothetical protein
LVIDHDITTLGSYALAGCENIIEVVIPNHAITIGNNSFEGCTGLTEITIPNGVTSIGQNVFKGCNNLASLTVPFIGETKTSNKHLGYWFGANSTYDNRSRVPSSLMTVVVTNATQIADSTFIGCENIISVVLNEGITSIGSKAFFNCRGLTEVNIPSTVDVIDTEAFCQCYNLQTVTFTDTIEQWNTIFKGSNWKNGIPATEVICSNGNTTLE